MPIRTLQPKLAQIGRIRLGDRKGNRNAPQALSAFRLTVPNANKPILEFAAGLYGGAVQAWENPMEGKSWELYTEANRLHVYVPPQMALEQWCEEWSGAGLVCRCDGETIVKHIDADLEHAPCQCDPDNRKCVEKTRFSVFLPDLPGGLNFWRVDTQGYYAGTQILGQIMMLSGVTQPVEGYIAITDERRKEYNREKKKYDTKRFKTLTLQLIHTPRQVLYELPQAEQRKQLTEHVSDLYGDAPPRMIEGGDRYDIPDPGPIPPLQAKAQNAYNAALDVRKQVANGPERDDLSKLMAPVREIGQGKDVEPTYANHCIEALEKKIVELSTLEDTSKPRLEPMHFGEDVAKPTAKEGTLL